MVISSYSIIVGTFGSHMQLMYTWQKCYFLNSFHKLLWINQGVYLTFLNIRVRILSQLRHSITLLHHERAQYTLYRSYASMYDSKPSHQYMIIIQIYNYLWNKVNNSHYHDNFLPNLHYHNATKHSLVNTLIYYSNCKVFIHNDNIRQHDSHYWITSWEEKSMRIIIDNDN